MKSSVVTVVRDVLCLLLGIGGIVHQEITGHVEPALLAVYASLLGIPSTVNLLQLARGRSPTTTDVSSPPSVSPPSSRSSS